MAGPSGSKKNTMSTPSSGIKRAKERWHDEYNMDSNTNSSVKRSRKVSKSLAKIARSSGKKIRLTKEKIKSILKKHHHLSKKHNVAPTESSSDDSENIMKFLIDERWEDECDAPTTTDTTTLLTPTTTNIAPTKKKKRKKIVNKIAKLAKSGGKKIDKLLCIKKTKNPCNNNSSRGGLNEYTSPLNNIEDDTANAALKIIDNLKYAFQQIKNAKEKLQELMDEIEDCIDDNIEKAHARLDHSKNIIGAGLALKVVKKLQHEYEHCSKLLSRLQRLENKIENDFMKARSVDKDIKRIMSLPMKQIETIDYSYKELVNELKSGKCYAMSSE